MIFGIGTDIIEVSRIEEKLGRTAGLRDRVYTPLEIAYCEAKHRPALHFAARFAAKEACLKAMGTGWSGGHKFTEIEVRNDDRGKPELVLHGSVRDFFEARGLSGAVSLSHIRDLATASVVLEAPSPRKD